MPLNIEVVKNNIAIHEQTRALYGKFIAQRAMEGNPQHVTIELAAMDSIQETMMAALGRSLVALADAGKEDVAREIVDKFDAELIEGAAYFCPGAPALDAKVA